MLGPWGAAIGAAIGHFMVDRKAPAAQRKLVMRFLAVMAGALHDIACCDGRYTPAKCDVIRSLLHGANAQLGHPLEASQLALLINGTSHVDHGITRLAERVCGHRQLGCEALSWLWQIASNDGDLSANEQGLIAHFIHHAGVSPADAQDVAEHFMPHPHGQAPGQSDWRSACDTLGVSYTASREEVKRAYRTLSQKYHPDKHTGLDPDIKALTAEKFAQIKRAYDLLVAGGANN